MSFPGRGRAWFAAGLGAAVIITGTLGVVWIRAQDPDLLGRVTDHIALLRGGGPTPPVEAGDTSVVIDTSGSGGKISPQIYGVSFADAETLRRLGATVDRWGGNTASTFNWINNCWNAARDWKFMNKPAGNPDEFIADARSAGAQPLVTIPTLGWVARDCSNSTQSTGVPDRAGYPLNPGSDAVSGYDPTHNRQTVYVPSLPKHPGGPRAEPAPGDSAVYQDEWVNHIASGVPYLAMDNEPDAWAETHTDVRPAAMGYDAMLRNFEDYASAARAAAPAATILGPDLCCWTTYMYSDADRGADNFETHADRTAHGDQEFVAWWLQQVAKHDKQAGSRSVDLLDVHYYPQADHVYSAAADPATQALRIRSVRSLYDPAYRDESWINTEIALIPRLKSWVKDAYPGTGIAITEYNWGGEKDASGAVALAEVLGVFGREGVDLATYWPYPGPDTPAGAAFRLYRNYDGQGATFGDRWLQVSSSKSGVRAFAARHSDTKEVDLVLANESLTDAASVGINLTGQSIGSADAFSITPGSADIVQSRLQAPQVQLPPLGLTLVRVKPS